MASNPIDKDDPAYVGNELYGQKEYEKALVEYSKSIEKHPDVAKLYTNRAMTYWKLNRPYDAWKDAEAGLKIEPNNEKLIYRKCTALLEMRQFHEASEFLDEGLKRMGGVPEKYKNEFTTLIDDVERLKSEFVEGRYNLPAMIEESEPSPILGKHADFYAWNKFELREIDGKGRGLVAKERIELGELLIACEAFVFIPRSEHSILMDIVRKKLSNRPDLAKQLYRLYAGRQLGHLENWKEGESELVDLERIWGVITHNLCFDRHVFLFGEQIVIGPPKHSAVYFVPSFINHTCIDWNCARYFVGNFVFIRATKAIDVGEELSMVYMPLELSFEDRQRFCNMAGFECRCRLCQMEGEESTEIKEQLKAIRDYSAYLQNCSPSTRASDRSAIGLLECHIAQVRKYRPGLKTTIIVCRPGF